MDQSQYNSQDQTVEGSGQKTPEKYTLHSTSLGQRYPTLKALLEADTRKLEGMRQYSKSSMPVHHNISNQGCVTSTSTNDGKRKQKDDENKPRKK